MREKTRETPWEWMLVCKASTPTQNQTVVTCERSLSGRFCANKMRIVIQNSKLGMG